MLLTESHRGGSNPSLTANSYMKVCLLLSGQMRNGIETFPLLKSNLLDRYDTDIFISTWDYPNLHNELKIYNPIAVDIENYEAGFADKFKSIVSDNEYKLESNANLISAASMWYKTMKVNNIRREHQRWIGTEYDIVIKTRPDILIEQPIEFIKPELDTLYVPKGWDWSSGLNDLMAYGNEYTMHEYCRLFYDFKKVIDTMEIINPERILRKYLEDSDYVKKIERPEIDLTLRDMNIKSTYWF
jgi:hypothetical protein